MKIHDVAYCRNCKKYFPENLTDGQGFICCPNCKDAYKFSVLQLTYSKEDGYFIEEQDEDIIGFWKKKDFDKKIKIMRNLIKLSKQKGATK